MPKITADGGPSNAWADAEAAQLLIEMGGATSAGTSSSLSEKKPEWSGEELQDTERSSPSPVPETEPHSFPGPQATLKSSSTAPSTSGSTQETGAGLQSPPNSSEDSAPPTQPTPVPTESFSEESPSAGGFPNRDLAQQKYSDARAAYVSGNYDETDKLLDEAEVADPRMKQDLDAARQAVALARSAHS